MSSGDGALVSASSITTVTSTGSHMLKINGYSVAKMTVANGSHLVSCEFEAAGHTWRILYYPNGSSKEVTDHISLFLRLARNVNKVVVHARFRFTLVPNHGDGGGAGVKKKPTKAKLNKPQGQSVVGDFWRTNPQGIPCFIRRKVLEKSEYLVDDSFAVRCDIHVVETSAVPDLTVDAHDLFRLSLLP